MKRKAACEQEQEDERIVIEYGDDEDGEDDEDLFQDAEDDVDDEDNEDEPMDESSASNKEAEEEETGAPQAGHGEQGHQEDDDDDEDVEVDPLYLLMAEEQNAAKDARTKLCAMKEEDHRVIVGAVDYSNAERGFPKCHQHSLQGEKGAEHLAYYDCSCAGKNKCYRLILQRPLLQSHGKKKKKKKKKKRANYWVIKSLPQFHAECKAVEPLEHSMKNRFIPNLLKLELIKLFDSGAKASAAHHQVQEEARRQKIDVTWLKIDVKNYFSRLKTMAAEELTHVLSALNQNGHFVLIDTTANSRGRKKK
jgi:hypothetical protein